jgi:hypothetical protein
LLKKSGETVSIYCEIKADDANDVIQILGDYIVELNRFIPIPVKNRGPHARKMWINQLVINGSEVVQKSLGNSASPA